MRKLKPDPPSSFSLPPYHYGCKPLWVSSDCIMSDAAYAAPLLIVE